jgi:hypothetical protein
VTVAVLDRVGPAALPAGRARGRIGCRVRLGRGAQAVVAVGAVEAADGHAAGFTADRAAALFGPEPALAAKDARFSEAMRSGAPAYAAERDRRLQAPESELFVAPAARRVNADERNERARAS